MRRTTRGRNPVGIEETTIAYSRYPRSICMSKCGSIATSTGTRATCRKGPLKNATAKNSVCEHRLSVSTQRRPIDTGCGNHTLGFSSTSQATDHRQMESARKRRNAYSLANLASLCCSGLLLPTSVNKAAIQCSVENTHANRAAFSAGVLTTFGKISQSGYREIDGQPERLVSELMMQYEWDAEVARRRATEMVKAARKDRGFGHPLSMWLVSPFPAQGRIGKPIEDSVPELLSLPSHPHRIQSNRRVNKLSPTTWRSKAYAAFRFWLIKTNAILNSGSAQKERAM